ncbi:MAG TPA: O-antigen ligase family protein [Nitrospiria bacterium]|nr:O-antigen ligase family protein [Nitrospiria bacterium]
MLCSGGALALLLLAGMRASLLGPDGAGRAYDLLLSGVLAAGALSMFRWTVDPGASQLGLIKLVNFVLIALSLPRVLRTPSSYRWLLSWTSVLAGGLAVYGFLPWPHGFDRMDGRIRSLFLSPNSLAGFLAATLPLTIAWSVSDRSQLVARGAWLLAVLQAAALAATGSRGGWLAATAGVMLTLTMMGWRLVAWRSLLTGIALLGCAGGLIDRLHPGLLQTRLASLVHPLTAEPFRYLIWQSSIDMIKARPLTGWGIGAFGIAYVRFKSPAFEGVTQYFAHNDYLQMAAEQGLTGLACWIGLIGAVLWMVVDTRRCRRHQRRGFHPSAAIPAPGDPIMLAGAAGGTAAILLHSLVDFDLYVPAILTVMAIFLGYLRSSWQASCGHLDRDRLSAPAGGGATAGSGIRVAVVGITCVVAALWVGRIWYAEMADRAGQRLISEGRYEEAIDRFVEATAWNPSQAAYHSNLGSAYKMWADRSRRLDLLVQAESQFRLATELAPFDYRYYLDLGRFYRIYAVFSSNFVQFDPWGVYRRAAELYPANTVIRLELNQISPPSPGAAPSVVNTARSA